MIAGVDEDAVIEAVVGAHPSCGFTAVVGTEDATVRVAARLRQRLGLSGGDDLVVVRWVHDKRKFRLALAEIGACPRSLEVASARELMIALVTRSGFLWS